MDEAQAQPLREATASFPGPEDAPPASAGSARKSPVQAARAPFPFVPVLRLLGEPVLVPSAAGEEQEIQAGLASLNFVYEEGSVLRDEELPLDIQRDRAAEARAERLLESFGALDLACVTDCLVDYDSEAHFLIALSSEIHVGSSFSAYAVPELKRQGFEIVVEPSFPFPTVAADTPWSAWLENEERPDWFSLTLGVEIEGKPYNLVPALLELIESSQEGTSMSSLMHCPARFRAVPLGDGRYVVLPWQRLRLILEVLADLYPDGSRALERLELPQARLVELAFLEEAMCSAGGSLRWPQGEEWIQRARALAQGPEWSPQPAALRATLRPYQHEGLIWLEHLRDAQVGGVLADDMGLGKTLQTIALLAREKEARRTDLPSLLVAPTSLVENWERECEKFAPHLRVLRYTGPKRSRRFPRIPQADLVVTSYPILIRDVDKLSEQEFHYVILDEAQAIKNKKSLASTTVRQLSSRHRLALTGTPVENNLDELWALFEFTLPGLLGPAQEFKKHFRDPIEQHQDEDRLAQLRKRVGPFILRRVKESVAKDLPPKTELVRAVELQGEQRDLYESIRLAADSEVRQAIASRGIAGSAVTILDALMKLRQVCCDPRLVSMEAARAVQSSAKYELFFELLDSQLKEGRRVLVFSQFTRMLALLSQGLRERNHKHLTLTGQSERRQALVDSFERGEADVFLISLKAGGTGLNLVSADTVIHYDPWWNAAAQMQATDRAYRIGQKKPVFVHNLIIASSVEARMLALQQKKRQLADTLLGQAGPHPTLSREDVEDLFAPLDEDESTLS